MKVRLDYKYKMYLNKFSQAVYHIISVDVDEDSQGYNCWGYERSAEGAYGDGVVFKPEWVTAGDALNAALKEYNLKYSPIKVTS